MTTTAILNIIGGLMEEQGYTEQQQAALLAAAADALKPRTELDPERDCGSCGLARATRSPGFGCTIPHVHDTRT